MPKVALITGITGQDGSYLAESLLEKGYRVIGLVRRASGFNTGRIDHLLAKYPSERFDFVRGDIVDASSLVAVVKGLEPDEIYNLAAQSHVRVSFDIPVYTFDTAATGTLHLLEAVRTLGLRTRIYQAGSSEMFGKSPPPQDEETGFQPRSPYAIAKVAAHHLCVNYREAYGMWIANGILFNHESPRRGETFVSRKISIAVARISLGLEKKIQLGNLDAKRDWGYAPEYAAAMSRMLEQETPDDYVIATGEAHSVREFVVAAFEHVGVHLRWVGHGLEEVGVSSGDGTVLVSVDPRLFRPTEVENLRGNSSKAAKQLGWKPKVTFRELVRIMLEGDLHREKMLLEGTKAFNESWRTHL